jgi:Fe-S-cluster containining protein
MQQLRDLRLKTACGACAHKCCSQPYDWVYLTSQEIGTISFASGLEAAEFVVLRKNSNTGHVFQALDMPCKFLDKESGACTIYEARPLVCRLFPFYPEPLTGHATLLPVQCGEHLEFLPATSAAGWSLLDYEEDIRKWLTDLWAEAVAFK